MSALRTLLLALFLVGVGFFVGYGYQARAPQPVPAAVIAPAATPQAPLVKGLHASPDGKLVAFTGVHDGSARADVWILNTATRLATNAPSPAGWQDFVTQWRGDGRALLLEREKIPRATADAKSGIYLAPVAPQSGKMGELAPLELGLPRGERVLTGLLAPDGRLLVRTRREPKSLFLSPSPNGAGDAVLVDKTGFNYGQNRPVREGKNLVVYVVRDVPNSENVALFRVENGRAKQLSPAWSGVSWSYVAPSGKRIIVARQDEDDPDWNWMLYDINLGGIRLVKSARVPADVISVYWSSDEKHVLGAAGERLWSVEVPSLKSTPIGVRTDWNADDATWLDNKNIAVATSGEIWRVNIQNGAATKLWRFPDQFWN